MMKNKIKKHYKKLLYKAIPDYPLTNVDLEQYARTLKIPNFRGVFMRNQLPRRIHIKERGIINLDSDNGSGTHWVAYKKNGTHIVYFDSYGNLSPPLEMISYFNSNENCYIQYNYDIFQKFNTVNCGQLCLYFLLQ